MQSVVGAGLISGIASVPLAAKAAPKAHKTGQNRVKLFVVPYVLVLFQCDKLRQVVAPLYALERSEERRVGKECRL